MNDHYKNEPLLNDILAEETPAGFREALLDQTLRLAWRRRQVRRVRVAALPIALIAGVFFLVWHARTPTGPSQSLSKPYEVVQTQPLPPEAVLETRPVPPANLVITAGADVITTAAAGYRAKEIDDEELLELAAPNPAVLVRHGSHDAQLVFANAQ
jgi:hypothetical protein